MRLLLRLIFLLFVLLAVLAAAGAWWLFYRPLPQLDGTISAPELQREVTVDRDVWGVPHIRAQSLEDLILAQGYVVAQDRLWQMDILRRVAAGELSEIFGAATLELDRQSRTLGLRQAAQRSLALLDPTTKTMLEAYSRGVNRYIEERRARLPWEFVALRYEPRRWEAADSLLVAAHMYTVLTSSWRAELERARLAARVGPERARDLFVVDSPLDHFLVGQTVENPKRTPKPAKRRAGTSAAPSPVEEPAKPRPTAEPRISNLGDGVRALLDQYERETEFFVGSNNWVVDGTHTYSGKPILANDTHLQLDVPCIWYMLHLTAPGISVKGFTIPGAPLVILGHNDRIAWGFTNSGADVQDLYIKKFNPANPQQYLHNGHWVSAEIRREVIRVRGEADRSQDVVVTRHGPIVQREGNIGYALRWTATEPGGLGAGYSVLGLAHNWPEFRDQLRRIPGPAQNIVYADVDGNIAFIVAANIPVRRRGDGSVPVPGDTDDYDWIGYIPFDELPQVLNPPSGIIATANARVTGPGYRWHLTQNWMDPHRAARIYELLAQEKKFRPGDFITIQTDIVSLPHKFLAEQLLRAAQAKPPGDPRAREAVARLAGWDGRATVDSVEVAFVEYTRRELMKKLLKPYVGEEMSRYRWWRHAIFLENVLQYRPARWLPKEFPSYDDLLASCADEAARQLERQSGQKQASEWRWGRFHQLQMLHPLNLNVLLRGVFSVGPVEDSGTGFTVKQAGSVFGPSQRFVADLANWDNSLMNITLGQSGQFGSPHFRDQFPAWFTGRGIPSPFSEATQEKTRRHRLLLLPPRQAAAPR
jgi:penicillin amidase